MHIFTTPQIEIRLMKYFGFEQIQKQNCMHTNLNCMSTNGSFVIWINLFLKQYVFENENFKILLPLCLNEKLLFPTKI